jgi:broad specificity phosphatase PhoE
MHLFLVRHAERLVGEVEHHDLGITERGRRQAASLAGWFVGNGLTIDLLLSSTLPRAEATAMAVASATGSAVVVEPRLREVGTCAPDGIPLPDDAPGPYGFPPRARPLASVRPGGESWVQFRSRVASLLDDLVAEHGSSRGRIFLVCHSGVHNAVHELIAGAGQTVGFECAVVNTGITHWEYLPDQDPHCWRLHGHNLAYHLLTQERLGAALFSGAPLPC